MSSQQSDTQETKEKAKRAKHNTTTAEDRFVKRKSEQIKEAAKKGNKAKANRHAVEIIQYLGIDDNELPIEDVLESP